MNTAIFIVELVVAYLLGSLSGSMLLGRLRGVDIREHGSGNAGGTNALRTQGWLFAAGVVAIDVAKGALAAALAWLPPHAGAPAPLAQALAFGFAAALGHVFPLYYGFRGGKGAATALGALAVIVPGALVAPVLLWLVVLGLTGYVGLATVAAALALPLAVLPFVLSVNWSILLGWAVAYAGLIVFTHRANLARVRAGTELRFERARVLARILGLDRKP